MGNNSRLIKKVLYRLKRERGGAITLKRPDTNTYDVETGAVSRTFTTVNIRRAIILPVTTNEMFTYTLAYIVANKNFTYGAFYNRMRRDVIIEAKDLGQYKTDFNRHWLCIINGREFNIESIDELEEVSSFVLKCLRSDAGDDEE